MQDHVQTPMSNHNNDCQTTPQNFSPPKKEATLIRKFKINPPEKINKGLNYRSKKILKN